MSDMDPQVEERLRLELANTLALAAHIAWKLRLSAQLLIEDEDGPRITAGVRLRDYRAPMVGRGKNTRTARRRLVTALRDQQAERALPEPTTREAA